jgi:amino acid transporter
MGLLVSSNNASLLSGVGAAKSPWVIAIQEAGIKGLPSVINAVVLTSAWSSGNASLYNASRVLYGLANDGRAPRIFRKVTKNGLPIYALLVTIALAPLGFMSCGSAGASNAFSQLSNLTSISGLLSWGVILFTYLRFHYACRKQGVDRNAFAYKAPFQPYLSYWGLTMICLIVFFNGYTVFLSGLWDTTDFVMDYIGIPILLVFYGVWKMVKRTKFVSLDEMDLDTGRRAIDELTEEAEAKRAAMGPQAWYMRVWSA